MPVSQHDLLRRRRVAGLLRAMVPQGEMSRVAIAAGMDPAQLSRMLHAKPGTNATRARLEAIAYACHSDPLPLLIAAEYETESSDRVPARLREWLVTMSHEELLTITRWLPHILAMMRGHTEPIVYPPVVPIAPEVTPRIDTSVRQAFTVPQSVTEEVQDDGAAIAGPTGRISGGGQLPPEEEQQPD